MREWDNNKEKIGPYAIEGCTRGGMGIVYFIKNQTEDDSRYTEKFILKTFRPDLMQEDRIRRAFRREAEIWIKLSTHQNIVRAYKVFEENGQLYVLAERIKPDDKFGCVSIAEWLKHRPFWILETVAFGIQVCRAMNWAQKEMPGFVHRDIKPGNLLLSETVIKVNDFGFSGVVCEIAKLYAAERYDITIQRIPSSLSIWGKGAVGTLQYMAPEVIREEGATVSSDIYSFGVTLYHILSGRLPFSGSEENIMRGHLNEDPIPLSRLRRDIPEELESMVMRCLTKDPRRRFSNFKEIGLALQQLHISLVGTSLPKSETTGHSGRHLSDWVQSLEKLGNKEDAAKLIDKAKKSGEAEDLYAIAKIEMANNRFAEAEKILRQIIVSKDYLDGTWPGTPYVFLANTLFNLEKYNDLKQVAEEGLKRVMLSHDKAYLMACHGAALLMLGDKKDAETDFEKACSEAEDNKALTGDIANIIGLGWLRSGNNAKAERWFRHTLKLDGDDACALFNLALACEDRVPEESIELWKRFLKVVLSNDSYVKRAKDNIARLERIIS